MLILRVGFGVLEDGLVLPEVVGGPELFGVFGLLALVAGFRNPILKDLTMAFELVLKGRVVGEIVDLVWIRGEVVELLGGSLAEPVLFLVGGELSFLAEFFELENGWAVVAVLGLEKMAVGKVVSNVTEFAGSDGADPIDGVVASIAG